MLERFAKTGVADHMQKDVLRGMLEAKEMLRELRATMPPLDRCTNRAWQFFGNLMTGGALRAHSLIWVAWRGKRGIILPHTRCFEKV